MPFDIFAEYPFGLDFTDNSGDLRPEVAGIAGAASVSGVAERLTGISGSDDMNAAAPRSAVEGSKVVPDRRLTQGLVRHPRHESGRGVTFPLDETHSSISRLGDMQSEIEAGITRAEGDSPEFVALRQESGM